MKAYKFYFLIYIFLATSGFSQENLIVKNDIMLNSTGSLLMAGTNKSFALSTSGNYFMLDNLYIGAELSYLLLSLADETNESLYLGPNIGFVFKKAEHLYPYLSSGLGYNSFNNNDSSSVILSFRCGLLFVSKKRIGSFVEISYDNVYTGSKTGNIIKFGFGFTGFINFFSEKE